MVELRYVWMARGAQSAVTVSGTTLMPVLFAASLDFHHMVCVVHVW